MKKFLKAFFAVILFLTLLSALTAGLFLLIPVNFEISSKSFIKSSDFTTYYDTHNNELTVVETQNFIQKEDIRDITKKAFIASEDKNFYNHKGLDYLRIAKAIIINIKNKDYSQGASTITQQLVKNNLLSSEKTIIRKLKEIKLAQKVENVMTKDEIITAYLNTIYFGHDRYGIESAAKYYYGKSESELNLTETAELVATIRSPSAVNPQDNKEKLTAKRNDVLKRMYKLGYITEKEMLEAREKKTTLVLSDKKATSPYISAAENELSELKEKFPTERNLKVYLYYDDESQAAIKDVNVYPSADRQLIVIDNETCGITAYYSTCGEIKRFPASTLKPLAVYAPAIEEDLVTEMTMLDDKACVIDGYAVKNYNDVNYGSVTVKEALKKSLNVPAVKILNSLGTDKALKYLNKLGFNENNEALNLAVGVTNEQVELKTLCAGYTTFACGGYYKKPRFIRKIASENGKTLYENDKEKSRVFSNATSSVITNILKECSLSGTAKKLNGLRFDVASKTGTCGNENGNTDAYCISYTTERTIASWIGSSSSFYLDNDVTGGEQAAVNNLKILENIYKNKSPKDFVYIDTEIVALDKTLLYSNGKLAVADENAPDKDIVYGRFKVGNKPVIVSTSYTEPFVSDAVTSLNNDVVSISFTKPEAYKVRIYKISDRGKTLVYDGNKSKYGEKLFSKGKYVYYIVPYVVGKNKTVFGKEIILPEISYKTDDKRTAPLPDEWWKTD